MINLFDSGIIDILPSYLKYKDEVIALSYALKKANQRFSDYMNKSFVFASIDTLPEKILDVLAVQLRSPYYDSNLDITKKRRIIKNTLHIYSMAGTPAAVEEMIDYVFGSGEVIEWFENGGEPGTFGINTTASPDIADFETFSKLISKVKNLSSHLTSINFGIRLDSEVHIAIQPVFCIKTKIK